jgi:hypothetical protein
VFFDVALYKKEYEASLVVSRGGHTIYCVNTIPTALYIVFGDKWRFSINLDHDKKICQFLPPLPNIFDLSYPQGVFDALWTAVDELVSKIVQKKALKPL